MLQKKYIPKAAHVAKPAAKALTVAQQVTLINNALTSHKVIAVLFYNTLRHDMTYADPGAMYYEDRYKQRVLANLQRRAKSLGFALHAVGEEAAQAGVS